MHYIRKQNKKQNKWFLSNRPNAAVPFSTRRRCVGSEFLVVGLAIAKARRPYMLRRWGSTANWWRTAECRCCLAAIEETRNSMSPGTGERIHWDTGVPSCWAYTWHVQVRQANEAQCEEAETCRGQTSACLWPDRWPVTACRRWQWCQLELLHNTIISIKLNHLLTGPI